MPVRYGWAFFFINWKRFSTFRFCNKGVAILENFPPHLFEGEEAVKRWSENILSWHKAPSDLVLKHRFDSVQDLRIGEDQAFLSLSTNWTILEDGDSFEESGGWAVTKIE
jgi:hypothetical protein